MEQLKISRNEHVDSSKESVVDFGIRAHHSVDDETEDEEVKLNCIGGLRGYHDSDFSSDSEEEPDDDEMDEAGKNR